MNPINLGDRVRISAAPSAPVMTVVGLYLQDDEPWASCSWKAKAQLVECRLADLVQEAE